MYNRKLILQRLDKTHPITIEPHANGYYVTCKIMGISVFHEDLMKACSEFER